MSRTLTSAYNSFVVNYSLHFRLQIGCEPHHPVFDWGSKGVDGVKTEEHVNTESEAEAGMQTDRGRRTEEEADLEG